MSCSRSEHHIEGKYPFPLGFLSRIDTSLSSSNRINLSRDMEAPIALVNDTHRRQALINSI